MSRLATLLLNSNLFTGTVPDDYVFLGSLGKTPRNCHVVFYLRPSKTSSLIQRFSNVFAVCLLSADLVRMDKNSLTGEIPATFCAAIDTSDAFLFADCLELNCPCCRYCCFDELPECRCTLATVAPDQCVVDTGL